MTVTIDSALLARRLDRLRPSATPPSGGARRMRATHAADLAAALGGTADGAIVVFESSHHVPVDRAALGRLPVPLEGDGPLLCLDLETTGLATAAGTLAFLIGLGSWDGDRLTVRQFLLPDHADEVPLLAALASVVAADATLITYNGRSFDWPLLVARYRLHRRAPPPFGQHLDLLPISRQLWRPRLGNARLSTVEQAVCSVRRYDDLPGALIPERYFRYLRERRPEALRAVVEHNRQDIVTLGHLLAVLARLVADRAAWPDAHPSDLGGLARALARHRRWAEALECIEAALASPAWRRGLVGGGPIWRRLTTDRARLLGRLGRHEEQAAGWLDMARRGGPGAAAAWLHVARHREHRQRDVGGALEACQQALAAAERARLWGRPVPTIERDLAQRMARLRRRDISQTLSAERAIRRVA